MSRACSMSGFVTPPMPAPTMIAFIASVLEGRDADGGDARPPGGTIEPASAGRREEVDLMLGRERHERFRRLLLEIVERHEQLEEASCRAHPEQALCRGGALVEYSMRDAHRHAHQVS